jgi:hypothetical protein
MDLVEKAKPSVRMGRKATGLAGETPGFPRSSAKDLIDSRVAEVNGKSDFLLE